MSTPLRVPSGISRLAVVPVAIVWGTGFAALTAVLSALAYAYLFIPPVHTFKIADPRDGIALGVFWSRRLSWEGWRPG
jgi:K+-sensing histidine kinase KdpD